MQTMAVPPEPKLDPTNHTHAPLRLEGSATLDAPADRVWAMVSSHENLRLWLPRLRTAAMDHSTAATIGQCSVGSERHCNFGGGVGFVDERIVWWNPPSGYAFTFAARNKMMMPTADHLNVFLVEPQGVSRSRFTWLNYFQWEGAFMRHLARMMMPGMLDGALANLVKQFGGSVSNFRWVD